MYSMPKGRNLVRTEHSGFSLLHEDAVRAWSRVSPRISRSHWWLVNEFEPIAYACTMFSGDRDEFQLTLDSIEVRKEFVGQGYSRRIVDLIEEVEGFRVYTIGDFTPEGYNRLSWLPLTPWGEPEQVHHSQSFVQHWDSLTVKYF